MRVYDAVIDDRVNFCRHVVFGDSFLQRHVHGFGADIYFGYALENGNHNPPSWFYDGFKFAYLKFYSALVLINLADAYEKYHAKRNDERYK